MSGHEHETERRLTNLESNQEKFFDTLLGPEEELLDGTRKRRVEEGMKHKVDFMYDKFANGGLRVSLPPGLWVAIVIAVIGGIAQVVSAVMAGG